MNEFTQEQLLPELGEFTGDYPNKVLEFCIKENPEKTLLNLLGSIKLREITKRLGLVHTEKIKKRQDLITLILLQLGFSIPPRLYGIEHYKTQLHQHQISLSKASNEKEKAGTMSQIYVETEKLLRDLVFFYIHCIWKKELQNTSEKQLSDKISELLRENFPNISKPFMKLGFGDFIDVIRQLNKYLRKSKYRKGMQKNFGRYWILSKNQMAILNRISPYRSAFTHYKKFPGDEACTNIISSLLDFASKLEEEKIYPLIVRIIREISDEYNRRYSVAIDETGTDWTIYTKKLVGPYCPIFHVFQNNSNRNSPNSD